MTATAVDADQWLGHADQAGADQVRQPRPGASVDRGTRAPIRRPLDDARGLPVALHFFAANRNEHHEYPELYRKALRHMGGRAPVAVVADRGLSFKAMFEFHTRQGVGLICPDRNHAPGQT